MGKVVVPAQIESLEDLFSLKKGTLTGEQVRRVSVPEALIDTGAMGLHVPPRLINSLGLSRFATRRVRTSAGLRDAGVYDAVRLTVQGRNCTVDVVEFPEDCSVLIGQVPLELLDFVVDPINRRLMGNPEHNGEHMIDEF